MMKKIAVIMFASIIIAIGVVTTVAEALPPIQIRRLVATGATTDVPVTRLNTGYSIPVLGLGTWTLNNKTAEKSVYFAIQNGYRLIDTARYYGNEAGVGRAVKRAIVVSKEYAHEVNRVTGRTM